MEALESFLSTFMVVATIIFNIPIILNITKKDNKDETMIKIIKSIGLIFLTFMLFTLILMPIDFFMDTGNSIFLICYAIFILLYFSIKIIIYVKNYFKVIFSDNKDIYIRDVFVKYSPAVLGLLKNNKINDKRDFIATILNIYSKDAIDLEKVNGKIKIKDLNNTDVVLNKLEADERYVYYVLTKNQEFDIDKWHSIVERQLDKRKFVKKENTSLLKRILKISLIAFLIFILLFIVYLVTMLFISSKEKFILNAPEMIYSMGTSLVAIPISIVILKVLMQISKCQFIKDDLKKYTDKGALEVLKWKKFEKFIRDFSMIETAEVESVKLWDKYMAYAMALNINKSYKSEELNELNRIIDSHKWFI